MTVDPQPAVTVLGVARRMVRRGLDPDFVIAYLRHEVEQHAAPAVLPPCATCEGIVQSDRPFYRWWPNATEAAAGPYCHPRCVRRATRAQRKQDRALRLLRLQLGGREGVCPRPEKRGYVDEDCAVATMNDSRELSGDRYLRAYLCACDLWHLGHWRKQKPKHQRAPEVAH